MIKFTRKTPGELGSIIANNVRARRKGRGLSMESLAQMSGVSYGSIRRFETTGEISLKSLIKIAIVLDCTEEFEQLFERGQPQSIQEIIDGKL